MLRVRFHANLEDPRPLSWPIKYPYWITGTGEDYTTIVAYADDLDYIGDNWPEAHNIDTEEVEQIEYTSRFPKPDWYLPPSPQPNNTEETR